MFSKILTSALIAGAAAGLIAALLQLFFLQPVLLHAELFESGVLVHSGASDATVAAQPFDIQRNILSVAFSMLIYAGYGLVLVAGMNMAEAQDASITAKTGIIWGIAGFVAVQLAPGFSLPPEVPGSAAADVGDRQLWWFATVGATMIGLWLVAFNKRVVTVAIAIALILAPHVVGAPQPSVLTGSAPTEIGGMFAARSLGIGLAAWSILGFLAGHFWSTSDEA
jgi:cobalt transporter subunit CbtA